MVSQSLLARGGDVLHGQRVVDSALSISQDSIRAAARCGSIIREDCCRRLGLKSGGLRRKSVGGRHDFILPAKR